MATEYIHLEHDGKLLLVDLDGNGPAIPTMGRSYSEDGFTIRLPSVEEVASMGIKWKLRRINRIRLDSKEHIVNYGIPDIPWPENWAWKDSTISDSSVDPVARESVYRTIHRVVSKVVITNSRSEVLMAKVSRGFFTGCWTLPGGFVDYGENGERNIDQIVVRIQNQCLNTNQNGCRKSVEKFILIYSYRLAHNLKGRKG